MVVSPILDVMRILVPLLWGACAIYLVFGTKRQPPSIYPLGIGLISGLLFLSANNVGQWVPIPVPDDLVVTVTLIMSALLVIEICTVTIYRYHLGHKYETPAKIAGYFNEKTGLFTKTETERLLDEHRDEHRDDTDDTDGTDSQ